MKIWQIRYECSGSGHSGVVHLTAPDLLSVCRDFDYFWDGRQETDRFIDAPPYFGDLLAAKVIPWAPYSIDDKGRLAPNKPEAEGYLEWKIDGAAAGFDFMAWAEACAK